MIERDNSHEGSSRPVQKWGAAAIAGWQALPDVLLKNQSKLGLSATDMVVLVNVLSYWWYVDDLPFPRATTLAKRMNVTVRTVQRALQTLINKGLLTRKRDVDENGKEREVLDTSGLVETLQKMALADPGYEQRRKLGSKYHE